MRLPVLHAGPCAAALLSSLLALPISAAAAEFNSLQLLNQTEFFELSQDLGAATTYKMLAPAEPLGVTGFDIALTGVFTSLEKRDTWRKAAGGSDVPSTLPLPGIRIAKGLPYGFDIGATLSAVPKFSGTLAGAELRWAVVEGSTVVPAVGVRVHATRLSGVDQLSLTTTGIDLSVSKGFAFVTPYAGIGAIRTSTRAKGVATLSEEDVDQGRAFVGGHVNLGVFDFTVEADRTGDATSLSARLGFRF